MKEVPVDGEVEAHELRELGIIEAQHGAVVSRPVLVVVDGPNAFAVAIRVAVDRRSDHRQLGDQIHRVLVNVLPTDIRNFTNTINKFFYN